MTKKSGAHFDTITTKYEEAAKSWECVYLQAQSFIDPLIQGKKVLDIGNGAIFPYNYNLPSKIVAADISREMLKKIQLPDVDKIVANALDLAPVKDRSIDVVLYILSIHHINGESFQETMHMLDKILAAAHRVLKPGGVMIAVEPVFTGISYSIEKACYSLTRRILALRHVPMVFFHGKNILRKAIAGQFMIAETAVKMHPLTLEGFIDPLGGSLPGLIKIPVRLYPATFNLFQARKE